MKQLILISLAIMALSSTTGCSSPAPQVRPFVRCMTLDSRAVIEEGHKVYKAKDGYACNDFSRGYHGPAKMKYTTLSVNEVTKSYGLGRETTLTLRMKDCGSIKEDNKKFIIYREGRIWDEGAYYIVVFGNVKGN